MRHSQQRRPSYEAHRPDLLCVGGVHEFPKVIREGAMIDATYPGITTLGHSSITTQFHDTLLKTAEPLFRALVATQIRKDGS